MEFHDTLTVLEGKFSYALFLFQSEMEFHGTLTLLRGKLICYKIVYSVFFGKVEDWDREFLDGNVLYQFEITNVMYDAT
ncbi:hypothetical protein ACS0TY_012606 [Phlomoides rotata]